MDGIKYKMPYVTTIKYVTHELRLIVQKMK